MTIAEHLISLERSALDRWIRADPDGYFDLYAREATYFDPFREKRIDGLDELAALMAAMRGVTLPFTEPRYDMIDPVVQVEGSIAVPAPGWATGGRRPRSDGSNWLGAKRAG